MQGAPVRGAPTSEPLWGSRALNHKQCDPPPSLPASRSRWSVIPSGSAGGGGKYCSSLAWAACDGWGTTEQVPPQSQWVLWSKIEAGQLTRGWLKGMTPHTDGAGLTCQCSQHLGNPEGTGGRWRCHLPAQGFVSPQCYRTSFTVDSLTSTGMKQFQVGRFIRGLELTRAGCHLAALCSVSSKQRIRGRTLLTQYTSCLRFTITHLFIHSFTPCLLSNY